MICDSLREELLLYRETTAPPPRIPIPTTSNNPEAANSPPPPLMATLSASRKWKHACGTPPTSPAKRSMCHRPYILSLRATL
ncbi:hypothetical protein LOD99_14470 [Oopsacas minuta]|uniref:Uncharacterized protein n=1 Tax=Oopsacas minuta TaxID=111878 RepID=A0AAV7KGW5_9METZ|nr:hypothetical protein LOD99_14470 [Oopsacas minuta]